METVKAYADFEKDTLEAVISARSNILGSNDVKQANTADFELSSALGRLMAITESYPELKANTGFLNLQSQLAETEDKIAKARQFYNDTVLKFNNTIQVFPSNIVAAMTGFSAFEYLAIEEKEKEAIKVKF